MSTPPKNVIGRCDQLFTARSSGGATSRLGGFKPPLLEAKRRSERSVNYDVGCENRANIWFASSRVSLLPISNQVPLIWNVFTGLRW